MKYYKIKEKIKKAYLKLPLQGVFSIVKQIKKPSKKLYWYLRFRGDFAVAVDNSHSFRLRSYGSSIENSIFWAGLTGEWEAASVKLWIKLAEESDVVFDVGANNGIYALVAKAVNSKAKVYAFEPIDRIFDKLVENNQLNNYDIICKKCAVSNQDGTAVIYDIQHENSYSSSFNVDFAEERGEEVTPISIETTRLDTFIEQNNLEKVDLIKIDVETFEPEVLEGLGEYLKKFKPTLLIEILRNDIARKIEELVSGKGYLYFDINDDSGSIKKVERLTKSSSFNYLICTEDAARRINIY